MVKFLKGFYTPNSQSRRAISLAAWSGIAVFFFILLFRPFGLPEGHSTETLFLVAGMGLISFLSFILFLVVIPRMLPKWFMIGDWEDGPSDLLNFITWAVSATGMAFYVRFVAHVSLSILLVVRIVLICLMPSIIARADLRIASLRRRVDAQRRPEAREALPPTRNIEIRSDSGDEIVRIPSERLLYIRAADNYVEVIFRDGENLRSQLVRTTLKRVDVDLSAFPRILRCHRAFIVNLDKVEKFRKSPNGYLVEIRGVTERIPVSRAYQVGVREMLKD